MPNWSDRLFLPPEPRGPLPAPYRYFAATAEAHPKLRPVESPTAGVFLSGTCQGPKDIPETVAQASAAAAKVIGLLCKDSLTCNPCVAEPNELMCNGCSNCEKVCPYGAITYIDKEFRGPNRTTLIRRVAQVNPAVLKIYAAYFAFLIDQSDGGGKPLHRLLPPPMLMAGRSTL